MTFKRMFVSLLLGASAAVLAACATQSAAPQVPAAPQAPAAPVAAAPPAAAMAPTPATPPADSAAAESDTATSMEKKFREAAKSYKVVQRDGKTMYCKRERVIGTTIPTMQCMTEAQLRNQVESTEELKRRMRRGGGPCVQTGGGCAG
jgi:hypothetical protein